MVVVMAPGGELVMGAGVLATAALARARVLAACWGQVAMALGGRAPGVEGRARETAGVAGATAGVGWLATEGLEARAKGGCPSAAMEGQALEPAGLGWAAQVTAAAGRGQD